MSIHKFPIASLLNPERAAKLAEFNKQAVNYNTEADQLLPHFIVDCECWEPLLFYPTDTSQTYGLTKRSVKLERGSVATSRMPVFAASDTADEFAAFIFNQRIVWPQKK